MDINELLKDAIEETGISLNITKDELVRYTAERAAYLTTLAGDPGFMLALRAERDSVALYAGVNASMTADAADSRIVGIIQTVLLGLI